MLESVIRELLSLKKEGDYWDFKQQHHDKSCDLVKDIICLANNPLHKGERYLIFGVEDTSFDVVGIDKAKQIKQADVINTLRDAPFVGGKHPDVHVHSVNIEGKNLDVIKISDLPEKPYYLERDFPSRGAQLKAGTIYSRVRDANTQKGKTASSGDVEKMWRERFGILLSPKEKIVRYLSDYENWGHEGNYKSYYNTAPEYTIRTDGDDEDRLDFTQEWTRGEIGRHYDHGNAAYYAKMYYCQTCLAKVHVVIFDGGKKTIVAPDWEPIGTGRIYFYLKNSVQYAYQQHIVEERGNDFSRNIEKRSGDGQPFSIPVLTNRNDRDKFLAFARDREGVTAGVISPEPESDEEKQNEIFYRFINLYSEYREATE